MSTAALQNKPAAMNQAEWNSRVECAAGHHLLELYRLTDMVEGVLALRVQGGPVPP